MKIHFLFGIALALGAALPVSARAALQDGRRETQLAEDQALLKRQLARLKSTMEVLATRFESEGRTHAGKLLREGLKHLDERASELGSKTVEELMAAATSALEAGRTVQSVESQEAVVKSLEKLYAILTDRAGLEDLQKSLDELKQIQADLHALADREQKLRESTANLREKAATPEQKSLAAALEKAMAEQRDLLARTEKDARAQDGLELGEIQRQLERLQARQETDTGVLSTWKPSDKTALEEAQPALDKATEKATQAERLARAASDMHEAARQARTPSTDLAAVQRDLDSAAEREDRHQRASGDPAAKQASEALAKGAESVKKSASDPAAREATAKELDAQAHELDAAARAAAEEATAAREAATQALDKLSDQKSAAGQAAQAAKSALDEARKSDAAAKAAKSGAEKRLDDAQRATAEAQKAAQKGLDDQKMMQPALSNSQASAAQEAQKLSAQVGKLPDGQSESAQQARAALDAAAKAQQSASEAAQKSDAQTASKSAEEARQELAKAQAAVAKMAAQAEAKRAQSPEAKALESAQKDLEKQAGAMRQQSSKSGLSPEAQSATEKALAGAEQAMKDAASKLSQGQSSQASSSQKSALQKMSEAQQAASSGSSQARPEDKAEAQEQAAEQERIRQALLELAQRNQQRKTAQPSPSLDRAQASAGEAKSDLEEGDLDDAEKNEQKTERDMRQALDELGKEEEQYQKLRQEELLFKIAEQVRALLDEHRTVMKDTLEIDQQRRPGDKATHTQRLRLRKLGKAEEALAGRSADIGKAILAESSIVFAELFDEAQKDLMRIARDMSDVGDYQSGERVQTMQQDVEQSLTWLQEALAQEKERRRQEEQQKSDDKKEKGNKGKNQLVPDVAELKLLRRMEVDVLDSIDQFRAIHTELTADKPIDPILLEDIARLAVRHQRTSDLFQQFRKRLKIPDPEPKKDDQ